MLQLDLVPATESRPYGCFSFHRVYWLTSSWWQMETVFRRAPGLSCHNRQSLHISAEHSVTLVFVSLRITGTQDLLPGYFHITWSEWLLSTTWGTFTPSLPSHSCIMWKYTSCSHNHLRLTFLLQLGSTQGNVAIHSCKYAKLACSRFIEQDCFPHCAAGILCPAQNSEREDP